MYLILASTIILQEKVFQSEGLLLLPPGLQGPVQPAITPVLPNPSTRKHQLFSSATAENTSLPERRMEQTLL